MDSGETKLNLSAEHISVTLSGVDIVKDISLHVGNGQFVVSPYSNNAYK